MDKDIPGRKLYGEKMDAPLISYLTTIYNLSNRCKNKQGKHIIVFKANLKELFFHFSLLNVGFINTFSSSPEVNLLK